MESNKKRWGDFWTGFVLLVALETAAGRLVATHWTPNLGMVLSIAFLGWGLGLALGYSRFSAGWARLFGIVFTLFFVPQTLGTNLIRGVEWHERLISMAGRLQVAAGLFISRKPVTDPILFLLLMLLLFWLFSLTAGYICFRHASPWLVIIPTGLGLLIIHHYDRYTDDTGLGYIGVVLFCALLLLGRMTYMRYKEDWRKSGTFIANESGVDMGPALLGLVVVVLFFSSFFGTITAAQAASQDKSIPQIWRDISRPWENVRTRLSDIFASLRSQVMVISTSYGSDLTLGTNATLGDNIIFSVYTPETFTPYDRLFWRARSYDSYVNGHWSSSFTNVTQETPSSFQLYYAENSGRREVEFAFRASGAIQNVMFTPGRPIWFSRPGGAIVDAEYASAPDLIAYIPSQPVQIGETYRVRAWIGVPTVSQLRKASTDIPDSVASRYIKMPDRISPRFHQLALQTTSGLDTTYDKVVAVTQYLRRTIKYSEVITSQPKNMDPVEWFLFESKEGYCNYYASAEVLLLRSLGIPARVSVGYAEGDYDSSTSQFVVRARSSHAWPEVYFPGYGWVEFEPTVTQPERKLPPGEDETPTPDPNDMVERDRGVRLTPDAPFIPTIGPVGSSLSLNDRTLSTVVWSIVGLLLGGLYFWLIHPRLLRLKVPVLDHDHQLVYRPLREAPFPLMLIGILRRLRWSVPGWLGNWGRQALLSPFEKSFAVLEQNLSLLGVKFSGGQTAFEIAGLCVHLLPETEAYVQALLAEYHRAEYSPHPADLNRAREASRQVRRLAYQAFFQKLMGKRTFDFSGPRSWLANSSEGIE